MGEWQPIETIPQDGTKVFVWTEGFEWPEVVYYEHYSPEDAKEAGEPGYWRYAEELLADVTDLAGEEWSHWMPLPTPPAAAKE